MPRRPRVMDDVAEHGGAAPLPGERPVTPVVITGVGMVHALGTGGADTLRAALARGRSTADRVRAFSTEGLSSHLAVELPASALGRLIEPAHARRLTRVTQMTVAACRLALSDAGLSGEGEIGL